MNRTPLLAGNFGELRSTHFHAGLDFKTGGVVGENVRCVKDGIVSRVVVSPYGYGNGLYVEHEDGTTSVYGHLLRFDKRISDIVQRIQYTKESFEIDENFLEYGIRYKQGEIIAVSGNTGGSAGPHLHFEIRNTATQRPVNPLKIFHISDNLPPKIRAVYLKRLDGNGVLEDAGRFVPVVNGPGKYSLPLKTVRPGKYGVCVYAIDVMPSTSNKYGVYSIKLFGNDKLLYSLVADSLDFDQKIFLNDVKDFYAFKKGEQTYKCFGSLQANVFGVDNNDGGYFVVEDGKIFNINMVLSDCSGNKSMLKMSIKGNAGLGEASLKKENGDTLLLCGKRYDFNLDNFNVFIDSTNLFYSEPAVMKEVVDENGDVLYVLGRKETPVMGKMRLFVKGSFDKRCVVCERSSNGREHPVETEWCDSGLKANVGYLSKYVVRCDSVAPQVSFVGKTNQGGYAFKVRDALAGISGYRVEVDGRWVRASYEYKTSTIYCSGNEPPFLLGDNKTLMLKVWDAVNNETKVEINLN